MNEDEKRSEQVSLLEQRIRRLELTLKKMSREKREADAEIVELRRRCAKMYDDCQKLMRYELKIEEKAVRTAAPEAVLAPK